MTTKTITLALDAYEKLTLAKRAGESFSEVIRRAGISATPDPGANTGAKLRAYFRAGGSRVSETYLDSVEEAAKHDPVPRNQCD